MANRSPEQHASKPAADRDHAQAALAHRSQGVRTWPDAPSLRAALSFTRSRFGATAWLCALMLCASIAVAQTPPAGNAHPPTQQLSTADQPLPNPFGEHTPTSAFTPAAKHAFASALDLEPLRGLAVFHNGRVKVLDTLGREMVAAIAGRRNYPDFDKRQVNGAIEVTRLDYDPLFTTLDLTIDPAYYFDKALLGVGYLPLRRALLESEFGQDQDAIDRWMRVGRVTPMMIDKHGSAVAQAHMDSEPFRAALGRLDQASQLFIESKLNYELVAPERSDLPWKNLASLPDASPARRAALELGRAWRAGDASAANTAIRALAAELPTINAGVYPTSRRNLEMLYNKANAFEYGYWAYFFSLISLLLAFGTGRRWLARTGVTLLAVALALHAFGFVTRCMIAERFAIQNQFESMTGLSLFAATVGTAIMLARRQWLFGAAAAAVGFLVLITATQTKIPGQTIEREAAILNTSILLKYHVTTVLVSYGLISLGMVVSLFYLGVHYLARLGTPAAVGAGAMGDAALANPGAAPDHAAGPARTLKDLDAAQMIVLQLAFWTLGVGILLGAWWADHSWGRWWAFDPKETWALITWIVYLIVIHLRFTGSHNRGLTTAWLSVAGFVVMLWTYFGVNLLLPGLHAYA